MDFGKEAEDRIVMARTTAGVTVEKAKICAFNEELMRETSSKFQQWNNAVNVKEFDVQDKKQEQVGCVRRKSIVSPTLPATVEREEREEDPTPPHHKNKNKNARHLN